VLRPAGSARPGSRAPCYWAAARAEDIVGPIEPRSVETGTVVIDGVATFFRQLPGEGPPAVLVHGNPTHSEDWSPILERMRGPAIALDLPGWGRSARPDPERFDYSMHGFARFFSRFLERMEIGQYSLTVHDWGGLALISAQAEPERVRRLVVINSVPLLPATAGTAPLGSGGSRGWVSSRTGSGPGGWRRRRCANPVATGAATPTPSST
jgi:pimeloyl-ACP methyl ester carboxylesterase